MPSAYRRCQRRVEILEDRRVPSAHSILDNTISNDEAAVRQMLGPDLLTLGGPEDAIDSLLPGGDLAKPLAKGYAPGHIFTSFQGSGVAFDKIAALDHEYVPKLGEPTVLLYRPGTPVAGDTVDGIPDIPYQFIGWGYGLDHDPASFAFAGTPGSQADKGKDFLDHFPADVWQVHEDGVHLLNGGFYPALPVKDTHGSGAGFDAASAKARNDKVFYGLAGRVVGFPWLAGGAEPSAFPRTNWRVS